MNTTLKTRLTWTILVLSSLTLASLAVFSLYRESAIRQERQADVLKRQSENLAQQLTTYFEEIRLQSARQLIAFHEEGLSPRLARWQSSNPLIHEAKVLQPETEFSKANDNTIIETIELDSPDTPSTLRSGYYFDNKEIALYENGAAQPILVWTFDETDTATSWALAHRLAPRRQLRTASLSNEQLAQAFNRFIEQTQAPTFRSNVSLILSSKKNLQELNTPLPQLPGYTLSVSTTGESVTKWYSVYGTLLIALCVVVVGLCTFLIFRQTRKERQEAIQKTNFVSHISHEFKTPLTSISLYAELLAKDTDSQLDRPKLLETISRESHRLSDLVDNILALNALEKGKKQYRIETFDSVDSLKSAIEDYSTSFEQNKLTIEWEQLEKPILVRFDQASLRQIILNLLDNARKYAAVGKKVDIRIQIKDTTCAITVADHGPGIKDSHRSKVFETFFQESSALTQKSPGAGIGLSLSRRLACDCGGNLTLDPNYTNGAKFILTLPLESSPQSPT